MAQVAGPVALAATALSLSLRLSRVPLAFRRYRSTEIAKPSTSSARGAGDTPRAELTAEILRARLELRTVPPIPLHLAAAREIDVAHHR